MVAKVPILDGAGKLQETHFPDRLSATALAEAVMDTMAAAFAAGTQTNVTIVHNDNANSFSFTASGGGGNGTLDAEGVRDTMAAALRQGAGITIVNDDPNDTITVAANVISVNGKTGTITLTKSDIALDQVNNTSDLNKPISSAVQAALNAKATIPLGGRMMLYQSSSNPGDARITTDSSSYSVTWITTYSTAPSNMITDVDIWFPPASS